MKRTYLTFGGFVISITILIVLSSSFSCCKPLRSRAKEIRALWLHPGLFSKNADSARIRITELFDSYSEIGINNLFCYNTLKRQNGLEWDYLQTLIDEGHRRGIKIHAIFCPGYNVRIEGEIKEHPEWLIKNMDSTEMPNLNPALPEVRDYWLRRISETLKYDIDGIHLDYTRFPVNQRYSYDSVTCAAFIKIYGVSPLEVSHDCGSITWCEWIRWNTGQVTLLVKKIRELLDNSGKDILLGADVFPDNETANILIGQDWVRWVREGYIDILCPMLYTNNTELFSRYLGNAMNIAGEKCTVCPGIGIVTAENRISNKLLISEITIAREKGANGFAFFSGYTFGKEFRDTLKATVFRR